MIYNNQLIVFYRDNYKAQLNYVFKLFLEWPWDLVSPSPTFLESNKLRGEPVLQRRLAIFVANLIKNDEEVFVSKMIRVGDQNYLVNELAEAILTCHTLI